MKLVLTWLFAIVAALHATRTSIAVPAIAGFERFHKNHELEKSLGVLLVSELNCQSCHAAEQTSKYVETKVAPRLNDVASRVKPDYLRKFISDPHEVKPGTTMPALFQGADQTRKTESVEAIVHYLTSLAGSDHVSQSSAPIGGRGRGEKFFQELGCLACHSDPNVQKAIPGSIPHGDLSAKYALPGLSNFLQNPLVTRPSGRMPNFNLTPRESADLASYLLPRVPEKPGVTVSLYRGSWDRLPDFDKLEAVDVKGSDRIHADVFGKNGERFGLRFDATISIPSDGNYTFFLKSDDGSKLFIDGNTVVDHDGVHGADLKRGRVQLKAGRHNLRVDYFENSGGEEVSLEIRGRGLNRQPIENLISTTAEPSQNIATKFNPELAEKGRELFNSVGCIQCHEIERQSSKRELKGWASLQFDHGCLTSDPPAGIPDFSLSQKQRAILNRLLGGPAVKSPTSTVTNDVDDRDAATGDEEDDGEEEEFVEEVLDFDADIHQSLMTFNCYACHDRGGLGGVTKLRNPHFKSTQPEMGDEGRVPPSLKGVGAKLTKAWLEKTLADGADDRPYMATRMPSFGENNVGHLQKLFETKDSLDPVEPIELEHRVAKTAGWTMVGEKGFSCIKCHSFGRYKATGIQSIDMTIMTTRLREDWFKRYLRNPQVFRRGTRMPTAWPVTGKSLLTEILDADSDKQIQAVWDYLSDGKRARTPIGLSTDTMELIASEEPIIYRNFLEGAGSRAIGVGYPEGLNLAFDANQVRLAMIWQGAFIDARRHWSGRGQGYEPPMGEKIVKLEASSEFAVLETEQTAWPSVIENGRAKGFQFRGYRFDSQRRPAFMYSFGNFNVRDLPQPHETGANVTLLRELTVLRSATSNEQLYFLAARSTFISETTDGWYDVGSGLKIRIQAETKPILRKSGNKSELVVPVSFDGDTANIQQEFAW